MNLLKRLLFPPKCAACESLLDWYGTRDADALCPACLTEWNRAKAVTCAICGQSVTQCICLPDELQKAKCNSFRKLTYYHGGRRDCVQNRVIFHIKESRDSHILKFLARELTAAAKESAHENGETVLTYMPRGKAAKLEYGTDQAEQLAKELSRVCKIPCVRLIQRSRRSSNPEQKELSPTARKKNARAAFALAPNKEVKGKHIILVDDIVTTGNTMAAGARLLYRAGAASVCCLAVSSDDVNREMT